MKVQFTLEAEISLEQIGDFIARDNPARALTFITELREQAMALAELPRGFPLVGRYQARGIRRRPYRNYGILYSIEQMGSGKGQSEAGARSVSAIVIHRFIGPGQDYERLLEAK